MKTKRLLALLLCLVMVVGILPMTLSAAETATVAETGVNPKFDVMLDFNDMEKSTAANASSFASMVEGNNYFSTAVYSGTDGLSYIDRDGTGDMALRTTSGRGIIVVDSQVVLSDASFLLEYDVCFNKIAAGFNTVQLVYKNDGKESKISLMPVNPGDGVYYTYHMTNNQGIGQALNTTGSSSIEVKLDQWYHYAFYFDTLNNAVKMYRDGALIWYAPLTAFPDTMTSCEVRLYSGNSSSITYYDNIHVRSFSSMDINTTVGFEDIEITSGNSVAANATKLNLELDPGSSLDFSYVHATNAVIEKNGTNQYLVGSSTGKTLGSGEKRCFFQLKDNEARLATSDWTFAFDLAVPGITNDKGTPDDTSDDTVYKYSSYTVSLFGVFTDKVYAGSDSTYQNIFLVDNNGVIKYGASQKSTGITMKQGEWYRLYASYKADTQQVTIGVMTKDEGYKEIATFTYAISKESTSTYFRFGYNWQSDQWSKFYFDNFAFSTEPSDETNIDLDFEEGTAGDIYIPEDATLGGINAIAHKNGESLYQKTNLSDKLKYYTDENGNTYLGSSYGTSGNAINVRDLSLNTLRKKFVISFDFRINQTTTGYTMAHWRLGNANIPLWIISGAQQVQIRSKLASGASYAYTSFAFEDGKWYNLATVIDPIGKTASFYVGGLGTDPVYTTTFDYDLSAATMSAFSVGSGAGKITVDGKEVTDHLGYDNIRIYTIDETIESNEIPSDINSATLPTSGIIVENDFEALEAGTVMNSEAWNATSPFGVTATDGIIVENGGNKHYQPASGSGALSFNISSTKETPYTEGVIAIESDFTLGNNSSNSGNLVIAALKRVGVDGREINVPLLTSDASGKLTVVTHTTNYVLPAETVRIRLELSFIFHSVTLYVNGEVVASGIPLKVNTVLSIAESYFTDDLGNVHALPFTGYAQSYSYTAGGIQKLNSDGSKAFVTKYYENYGFAQSLGYIKDSIEMFGASANEAWSYAMDNIKIYLDKDADVYYNGFDSWTNGVVGTSESAITVQSPVITKNAKFIDDNGNRVLATVGEGSTTYNASFFIADKNKLLSGKSFVLEFDIKYNPDFALVDLGTSAENGMAILTDLKWRHSIRLGADGRYGIPDASSPSGYFKANDWSRIQALFIPNGDSHTARIYVDGVLASQAVNPTIADIIRIGCEANAYDAKFDNIRIYISDKPDAYETVITGALEGKSLFALEVADTAYLEKMMSNAKGGVTWNFKNFNTTSNNINESTVNVLLDKGDYIRVMHKEIKDSSAYNIVVNKAALEGHKQYVFETEIRYTCPTGFELEVLSTYDASTQTEDRLVYVLGTTREIVFNRNGFTYNLTDANGNKLYAENVTDDATSFTKIAIIVDEAAKNYSVYVNDRVAYYNYGGELVTATAIAIDYTPIFDPAATAPLMASTISLLNLSTSTSADALLDIKSANFYVLRNGVAPYVMATQSKVEADTCDVRFIAPIDMLYGKEVGFEVTTNMSGDKEVSRASNLVYSSIKALDTESGVERDFLAEEFDGTYLAVITVKGASIADTVEYTVRPFIVIGDSKIYNESFTVTYSDGKVVTE